jgi:hypothetical protein
MTEQPLILALRSSAPLSAIELLERGADPNAITTDSHRNLGYKWMTSCHGQSALDIANDILGKLRQYEGETNIVQKPELREGIDGYLDGFAKGTYKHRMVSNDIEAVRKSHLKSLDNYEGQRRLAAQLGAAEKTAAIKEAAATFEKIASLLERKGAKTFAQLYPDRAAKDPSQQQRPATLTNTRPGKQSRYEFIFSFSNVTDVTDARKAAYIEL